MSRWRWRASVTVSLACCCCCGGGGGGDGSGGDGGGSVVVVVGGGGGGGGDGGTAAALGMRWWREWCWRRSQDVEEAVRARGWREIALEALVDVECAPGFAWAAAVSSGDGGGCAPISSAGGIALECETNFAWSSSASACVFRGDGVPTRSPLASATASAAVSPSATPSGSRTTSASLSASPIASLTGSDGRADARRASLQGLRDRRPSAVSRSSMLQTIFRFPILPTLHGLTLDCGQPVASRARQRLGGLDVERRRRADDKALHAVCADHGGR